MGFYGRQCLRVSVIVALFLTVCSGWAAAAIDRPNALDRSVDQITDSALLSQPATALVDAPRQDAAMRLARLTLPGWIATAIFELLALAYFWSSGSAARWRDRLRSRVRNESAVRFLFGATLGLVARAAALLPAFYLYRVDRIMELNFELTRTWLLYYVLHTLVAMIIAGLIVMVVLWLVDRTHQWYVFTILAILAASVAWSYVDPYLQVPGSRPETPAAGTLGANVGGVIKRSGVSGIPVMIQTTQNAPGGNAFVVGLGDSRRIVITDTLVAGETADEVLYEVAYQIGHIVHNDSLYVALIEGGIVIVFSALAVVIADRVGFRRDDDPLSRLALVGALLAAVYLAAVPARNAALRSYVFDNDRYAVALTGNRAAAVRALVRETDQQMEEVCPEMLPAFFLSTHPSSGLRIAAINGVTNGCPK